MPSPELLQRFDVPGPRYTSYPTADRFVETFGADAYRAALDARAAASRVGAAPPLSIYVHVPFCESLCWYCACNKVVTKHKSRSRGYLDDLAIEIALHAAALGAGQPVSCLHLGGGTPTFLSDDELEELLATIRRHFVLPAQAELSIEVDPRTVGAERLARLRAMGFSRISFGVQDFDPQVQQAIHRVQPFEAVRALVDEARALGFGSINLDLIHGLPRQTAASFAQTLEQVGELRPDRIALYAYAHLPQRFKAQRRIDAAELPAAGDRVAMLGNAIARFADFGYEYIGMDHFALPHDDLAVARREGRLHRNFQGYTAQPDGDLIGLGVSAIGSVGATYSQNAKTVEAWSAALARRGFAVERGLALTADDLARRDAIRALMCQGVLDFEAIEAAHAVSVARDFAAELARLAPLAAMGLVEMAPRSVRVTGDGWFFVRAIAACFDAHLGHGGARQAAAERFSRMV